MGGIILPYARKQQLRGERFYARLMVLSLGILIVVCCSFFELHQYSWFSSQPERKLEELNPANSTHKFPQALADGNEWQLAIFIALLLYTFVAIAIVCDDFFVPALEIFCEKLQLTPDIAGATFMAAGGSAPELFTSFIGTFSDPPTDVGFGTVVGSAVFNVLFVIGCCAIFSRETLVLTWWPLFRDVCYYVLSLFMLAYFFKINTENEIDRAEAATLLSMYLGYVIVMACNVKLQGAVTGLYSLCTGRQTAPIMNQAQSYESSRAKEKEMVEKAKKEASVQVNVSPFLQPSTVRAGLSRLMLDHDSLHNAKSMEAMYKISGDVRTVFNNIDKMNDAVIDPDEMKAVLRQLGTDVTDEEIAKAFDEMDTDRNGVVDFDEFTIWYVRSEMRLKAEINRAFSSIDKNGNGFVDAEELRTLLERIHVTVTDTDIKKLMVEIAASHPDHFTKEEFSEWFQQSAFWEFKMQQGKVAGDTVEGKYSIPWSKGCIAVLVAFVTMPLVVLFDHTLPNPHKVGMEKYAVVTFLGSIGHLMIFSYIMVGAATIVGDTIRVNPHIMGLTVLAAGTSVPDLLTSVIVARQGKGDMAVSSSIGSNIFDVLIGLPLPWLMYGMLNKRSVKVCAGSLFLSILILLSMLIAIVTIIACNQWRMTQKLGYTMFVLYAVFVIQDVARATGDSTAC